MLSCYQCLADEEVLVAKDWIAGATRNKGALRRQLGVEEGEKIPASKLSKTATRLRKKAEGDKKLSKDELKLLRRVQLAQTLAKFRR
jgi:hypothetical protein